MKIHYFKLPYGSNFGTLIVLLSYLLSCIQIMNAQTTKSEIQLTEKGYKLFLNGEPFYVKGAGMDNGNMEGLAKHGSNSLRTWSMDNGKEILDQAHKLGLKVMMGIWVGLERHGFNYNDEKAIQRQFERIRKEVLQLKDHPALMIWCIGNEMNLESKNPKVWDAVNDIAKMIHEVDPNHLTTTPLAGIDKKDVALVTQRAPEIDFLSVQLYGPIDVLPQLIRASDYDGPLMVTEWGATGWWEVEKTDWGAPLENNSSKKADLYLKRYQNAILGQSEKVMGSYVFLWGQKQERTPTWFGMFMPDGKETESVDVMHYAWNGVWPKNRSPRLKDFTLNGKRAIDNIKLSAGELYKTEVTIEDPDNDKLTYRWQIMRESQSTKTGGDAEYIPEKMNNLFTEPMEDFTSFRAPKLGGAYRLFIYVEDGHHHTAHGNIPFWVED
ncbi:glycoside hydrolase family 2 TIM barrel-domain containing protein [Croceitalea rosinachiae]|uniref:Glycoside hydrolase family 2 TIM barrel-domain containing protein n=1 Tax=Croceitalea rosinachiae TaxID=3075596 RepID=A0ABU3A954_9FLAO|nr:glycoside hydrolase family 2 TIM barrel-domain containing protein [Croceitalea sp. F388]MDT0606335.1 glycoside hydrolase family 2 TIM barrel-domain containing protein [Croceitalea sp. F388]